MRVRVAVLLSLLAASACAPPRPDLGQLEAAAAKVAAGGEGARDLALAAFHAHLARGDGASLSSLASRAVAADPDEPWAQLAAAEAARRTLDDAAEAAALLELLTRAPSHPLALVAAGRLSGLARLSPVLAQAIDARTAPLRAQGTLPIEAELRLGGALRAAVRARGEGPEALRRTLGLPTSLAVAGPFSAYHALELRRDYGVVNAAVQARYAGPPGIGALPLRRFELPDGRLSLGDESRAGDVYFVFGALEVAASTDAVLRLVLPPETSARLWVDGALVAERIVPEGEGSRVLARAGTFAAGRHLVALAVAGAGRGGLRLSIVPLEPGEAGALALVAAAPGEAPGAGFRPLEAGATGRLAGLGAGGAWLSSALEPDAGVLGPYLAALDARAREPELARRLIAAALSAAPGAVPLLVLRAELTAVDPSLPASIARARAAGDLEAAAARDPGHARALLRWAGLLRASGRLDDAGERLERAEAAAPGRAAVAQARARWLQARGFEPLALIAAREAVRREPARCAARGLVYELARQADAVAEAEAAAQAALGCAGGRTRWARLLRERGRVAEARELSAALLAERPQELDRALQLADALLAGGDPAAAARTLAPLEASWPRSTLLPRRRAELLDRAGDEAAATEARRRALALDGSDLSLRRALAGGRDTVLADLARDGRALARAFLASGRRYDASSVIVLDAAATEAYPDGSAIERVHTLVQVLDKRGIDRWGEVDVPADAEVLRLRTLKRDGRVLEPETIAEKAAISMPELEPGDFVEVEWLLPLPSRGPSQPGWTGSAFTFRAENTPIVESVYQARAGAGVDLELDRHGDAPAPIFEERDGLRTATLRAIDVPAVVPEPGAPPRSEWIPWVQAGAGAGEEALLLSWADALAAERRSSVELETFARSVAAEARARDDGSVLAAAWERVMREIPGDSRGFEPATHVLAARRGSRLVLLRALLGALGVEAKIAAILPLTEDPAAHRFPHADRWSRFALVARTEPGAPWTWLDPSLRWAPAGALVPALCDRPAYLLPSPGEALAAVRTPPCGEALQRELVLDATLTEAGELLAAGEERFVGIDAARVRSALEQLDEARRRQAVEAELSRTFRGLVLEELNLSAEGPPGADVAVRYRLRVPGYARSLGDGGVAVDLGLFAEELGRRFLTRGARTVPLFLAEPLRVRSRISLALPRGANVAVLPAAEERTTPFGRFVRSVEATEGRLVLQDELSLAAGRIAPTDYPAFADFVAGIDRAQESELILAR